MVVAIILTLGGCWELSSAEMAGMLPLLVCDW